MVCFRRLPTTSNLRDREFVLYVEASGKIRKQQVSFEYSLLLSCQKKRTFSFMCSLLRLCVSLQICIINDASKQLVHEPCSGMMAIITYAAINVVSPLSFYIFQYTTTKPTDHQISDEKLLCSHFCEWPSHGNLDLVYLSHSLGTYLSKCLI